MKITSLKDITDESLKEMSASAVSDFIETELKEASEKYAAEKTAVEDALKKAKEDHEDLSKDHQNMKSDMDVLQTDLDTLSKEKEERVAEERFNQRMASFDEEYELSDEDRGVIATDVNALDDDEFSAYQKKMAILLSHKNKEVLAEENKTGTKTEEVEEKVEEKTAAAEVDTKEEVEEILDETVEEKSDIPATSEASEPSVYDKYKQAFGLDQFEILTNK